MKLVTPGDSAPASVNRYLLPHEQQVITVRRHPAVLLGPTAIVLGSLIAAGILSNTSFVTSGAMLAIIWWLWLLVLVWFVWKVAEWSVDCFVITSARLVGTNGLIPRPGNQMPVGTVTGMVLRRTLLVRVAGSS